MDDPKERPEINKISESLYETHCDNNTIFCADNRIEKNFNPIIDALLTKFPQLKEIDSQLLRNSRFTSIFEEYEEFAIIVNNDNEIFAIRLNEHIDSAKQVPTKMDELSMKGICDITGGHDYVILLTNDNQVFSFGQNNFGQLGCGNKENNYIRPVIIKELSDKQIIGVSCGYNYSMAWSKDGRLYGWGHNIFGLFDSDPPAAHYSSPVEIKLPQYKIAAISCGFWHCVALTECGSVLSWGCNQSGQLGNGSADNPDYIPHSTPTEIDFKNETFLKVCCGRYYTLLLSKNGDIYSFGENQFGQLGRQDESHIPTKINTSTKFVDIFAIFDENISIGLSISGKCWVWGQCRQRKVFIPEETVFDSIDETLFHHSIQSIAFRTLYNQTENRNKILSHFVSNCITIKHLNISTITALRVLKIMQKKAIIVSNDGHIYIKRLVNHFNCFEDNLKLIELPSNETIVNISCSFCHVTCLSSNKNIYSWGDYIREDNDDNAYEKKYSQTIIEELCDKNIIDISGGVLYNIALSDSGKVFFWGWSHNGESGIYSFGIQVKPAEIESIKCKIIAICCGAHHSLALSENGHVFSWGRNECGQLGDGTNDNQCTPTPIKLNHNIVITKICCGCRHSLILSSDGDIYSFGRNSFGQLGIDSKDNSNIPTKIQTDFKFVDIAAEPSTEISIGLSERGKCYVWGYGLNGSVLLPTETECVSLDEALLKYSDLERTSKPIILS